MTAPAIAPPTTILSDELLTRFHERAPVYDRENRFFHEDFEELRNAGYLVAAVPEAFGGHGLTLADVAREQNRLAYWAPATAIATNMHLYWTGVAADLWRMGDTSLEWILREAVAGEVFAAGHGERGNDLPLFLSTTRAERVDGGYRFYGRKMFGSLSPVWTRFGLHGMDTSDPERPMVVHAFMPRDTEGYTIDETWDTLGMRATSSHDTVLDGAFVPDAYIGRVLPAGEADLFILNIFAWAQTTFGAVYLGIGERARDLAVGGAKKRTSLALTRSMAYHPEIQHEIAEIVLAIEPAKALVERTAREWVEGADYGAAWGAQFVATKHTAIEAAKRAVDLAMTTSGGAGMFRGNELERLYRDVRAGGFHPANSALVHEEIGKTTLGIAPSEQPRWG